MSNTTIPQHVNTVYMSRLFLLMGSLLAGVAVIAGAFGAHTLERFITPERLHTFEIGVRYQMYHALALLAVGFCLAKTPSAAFTWAGYAFLTGIVVFSGSLYVLVLTDTRWLGAITPIGGVAFIAGWACLAWGFWNQA